MTKMKALFSNIDTTPVQEIERTIIPKCTSVIETTEKSAFENSICVTTLNLNGMVGFMTIPKQKSK